MFRTVFGRIRSTSFVALKSQRFMNIEFRLNSKTVNYEYNFLIDIMGSAFGFVKINMTLQS